MKLIQKKRIEEIIFIALVIILMIGGIWIFKPGITGFFISREGLIAYEENVTWEIDADKEYTLEITEHPLAFNLRTVRLTGSYTGNGTIKAYLEANGTRFLILNNDAIAESGLSEITGWFIAEETPEEAEPDYEIEEEVEEEEGIIEELPEEMEEVLEEELIDVDRPPEIKDTKPSIEETSDETNETTEKNDLQISVNKDSRSKESKKKTKNDFAEYWYLIIGVGVLLLILFLIYRRNQKRKSADFESYQNI